MAEWLTRWNSSCKIVGDIIINIDTLTNTDIQMLSMYLILFADDIVLFTTDPVSLQSQIDNLYEYSIIWGLKININKTKVCIFEKRRQNHNTEIYINGEKIEIVDSFTYLGVKLTYTGNMSGAINALSNQALKAYHSLLSLFDRVSLDIKTKLRLFDSMIVPILLYVAEVWGAFNCSEVDKLHNRFCKHILGVKLQTSNQAVYGELGRFPLSVLCKERIIKFWLKIKRHVGSPMYNVYVEQCNNPYRNSWADCVHSLIDSFGFSHLLTNFNLDINYCPVMQRRIRNQFL